jgi:hypothetical protein
MFPGRLKPGSKKSGRIGGPTSAEEPLSAPPRGRLEGPSCTDPHWYGLQWTGWRRLNSERDTAPSAGVGLYRIRKVGAHTLAYVGQGRIRDRLGAHASAARSQKTTQGQVLAALGLSELEFSYVELPDPHHRHLLEFENDLIASHVRQTERAPEAQFTSMKSPTPSM